MQTRQRAHRRVAEATDESSVSNINLFVRPGRSMALDAPNDASFLSMEPMTSVAVDTAPATSLAPQSTMSSDEDSESELFVAPRRSTRQRRSLSPVAPRRSGAKRTAGRQTKQTATTILTNTQVRDDSSSSSSGPQTQPVSAQAQTPDRREEEAAEESPAKRARRVQFVEPSATKPQSKQAVVDVQQTRRSGARSALDILRRNQIPNYRADVPDVERDVVIDRDQFRSLQNDSAFEYQDANKPPWAPRVPREMIDKVRTWELQEVLSELDVRRNPWYMLAITLAGKLHLSPNALIVLGPQSASAQAVAPTRAQQTQPLAGVQNAVGATNIDFDLAALTQMTPLREDGRGGFEAPLRADQLAGDRLLAQQAQRRRDAAPSTIRRPPPTPRRQTPAGQFSPLPQFAPGGGGGGLPRRDMGRSTLLPPTGGGGAGGGRGQPPTPARLGDSGLFTQDDLLAALNEPESGVQTVGDLENLILSAVPQVEQQLRAETNDNSYLVPQSGARFSSLRKARRQTPQFYERDNSDLARRISQTVRVEGARGRSWISRPLATGIFYLNPNYTAAREGAYTQIVSRADQLAHVEMSMFARPARSNTVQFRVRDQFAALIAAHYQLATHSRSGTSKLATDARNFAASAEAIVQFFVQRITFDVASNQFADTGAARALGQLPAWQQATFRRPLRSTFTPTGPHNPLLVGSRYGGIGTLLGARHGQ
jgi:hypothetical protein